MNYRNINTLIKPVLVLSQHMLMAAKGNLDCKVESDREDEIGQLEFSFNKMIDDLKQHRSNRGKRGKRAADPV